MHTILIESPVSGRGLVSAGDVSGDKPVALYHVTLFGICLPKTAFVLAETEAAAVDQARCVHKLSTYNLDKAGNECLQFRIERVPVAVEGWGGCQF